MEKTSKETEEKEKKLISTTLSFNMLFNLTCILVIIDGEKHHASFLCERKNK